MEASGTYRCGILNYSFASQQAWGHTGFWRTWMYWVPSLDLVISGASNQAVGDLFDADRLIRNVIDHGCVPMEVASQGLDLDELGRPINLVNLSRMIEQDWQCLRLHRINIW